MKTVRYLIQKEFLQIFRNRAMLPIIFVMPIIQLLVLANAATFEVRGTRVSLIDDDQSPTSRALIDGLLASDYFEIVDRTADRPIADRDLETGETSMILRIPSDFGRDLSQRSTAPIQVIIDAQDGATAGVIQSYLMEIVARFNRQVMLNSFQHRGVQFDAILRQAGLGGADWRSRAQDDRKIATPRIHIETANWFNPELDYDTFMVPGILVLLVTMIGLFLSGMNVVREKEIGTIEQLNVTPIRKHQLIIGKLTPFWILALVELAFGLVVAKVVFATPTEGSLLLIFVAAAIYLLVVLGIGLFISTFTNTQQQAMFIAWFIVVIFILMSGLFTPIESMPVWAQHLTIANPVAHFIEIMRRVMLKGADLAAVWPLLAILAGYGAVMLALATRSYSKVTA